MGRLAGFQQRTYVIAKSAVADLNAISSANVNAATEITDDLPNPVNFAGTSNFIDISDIGSRQDKQMLGTFSPGTIEFEVYRDGVTEAAYDVLTDEGEFVIFKFEKPLAGANPTDGDEYDAVHVQVGTKADVSSGRNESRRATVPCAVVGDIVRGGTVGGAESSSSSEESSSSSSS